MLIFSAVAFAPVAFSSAHEPESEVQSKYSLNSSGNPANFPSFPGHTPVVVPQKNGKSGAFKYVAMELLKKGDWIWSGTGSSPWWGVRQKIVKVHKGLANKMCTVRVDGSRFFTTPGQHVYTWKSKEGAWGWKPAKLLSVGDLVYSLTHEERFVESVTCQNIQVEVFNIETESDQGGQNYFVSREGILVHN